MSENLETNTFDNLFIKNLTVGQVKEMVKQLMDIVLPTKQEESLLKVVQNPEVSEVTNKKEEESELIRVKECSKLLKCPTSKIYNLIKTGKIPSYKDGNKVYLKKSEVINWFQNNQSTSDKVVPLNSKEKSKETKLQKGIACRVSEASTVTKKSAPRKAKTVKMKVKEQPAKAETRKNFMDKYECAAFLGYSVNTIQHMVQYKRIPYHKTAYRNLFEKSEIEAWLKAKNTNPLTRVHEVYVERAR